MLNPVTFEDIVVKEIKFSFTDMVALEEAAETDATVRAFLSIQKLSDPINYSDDRVVEGLSMLVEKGLVAKELL